MISDLMITMSLEQSNFSFTRLGDKSVTVTTMAPGWFLKSLFRQHAAIILTHFIILNLLVRIHFFLSHFL